MDGEVAERNDPVPDLATGFVTRTALTWSTSWSNELFYTYTTEWRVRIVLLILLVLVQ